MQKILVIDNDREKCVLLKRYLQTQGFNVLLAYNSLQGLELLELSQPQMVFYDLGVINNDGKATLLKIKELYPGLPVVTISGYSEIRVAIEMMKLGVSDYITKPIVPDEILLTISNAIGKPAQVPRKSIHGNVSHQPGDHTLPVFPQSISFQPFNEEISTVATTRCNVFIYGESGSGKEVIAREIHKRSNLHNKPFLAIHCGSLSPQTASEFFGYEKSTGTGTQHKPGSLELANGGTLFLKEVTTLSHEVQLLLLRFVQENKMRAATVKNNDLDIRIIITTDEKTGEVSKKGKLREDLYQRLNECSLTVLPLRERREDLMVFARHFLALANEETGKSISGFSPGVEEVFMNYIWYGNLHELKKVITKSALLTDGDVIEDRTLPFEISNFNKLLFEKKPVERVVSQVVTSVIAPAGIKNILHENSLKEVSIDAEYEMIIEALKHSNYNKSKAARFLNIDRKTLYNKMKQYQQLNNH